MNAGFKGQLIHTPNLIELNDNSKHYCQNEKQKLPFPRTTSEPIEITSIPSKMSKFPPVLNSEPWIIFSTT